MNDCRCARCRRREIYNATGMTLSLAWNKKLNSPCCLEKFPDTNERHGLEYSAPLEMPVVKEAS